jgi:hypothetical protein
VGARTSILSNYVSGIRAAQTYELRTFAKTTPHFINTWFDLVRNIKAKYGILDEDTYSSGLRLNVGHPLVN